MEAPAPTPTQHRRRDRHSSHSWKGLLGCPVNTLLCSEDAEAQREVVFVKVTHLPDQCPSHSATHRLLGIKHGLPKDSLGQRLPAGVCGSQLEGLLDSCVGLGPSCQGAWLPGALCGQVASPS